MDKVKYNLTWQHYSDHLKSMMKDLMMNEEFSDVTLVTEDKKHIMANINILSACSPVFKEILKKQKNSSQIMYLRGIQFSEMESILQFIYLGEATFYEERMGEFLAVAKSLEIKELCNTKAETNNEPDDENSPVEKIEVEVEQSFIPNFDQIVKQPAQESEGVVVTANSKYECGQCHKKYSSTMGLIYHKQSVHEGLKYGCDQCDFQGITQSHLTRHIQTKHEGIKHSCDQCDFQSSRQDHLTKHIQSKHEGIKYACDQCDHQFSWKSALVKHVKLHHKQI